MDGRSLPINVLLFHQQMKAKELEEVFRHEAEPVFSRSPITGRCAYDLPGMVKPAFIRRQTPVLAGMVDDSSSKSDIVGQPRIRCPTREGLVDLQRANLESIIRERKLMKGKPENVDSLAAAATEIARQQVKDGVPDEGVGALESLRRLREHADQPSYTEVQADDKASIPRAPSDSRSWAEMRRDPSAAAEAPSIAAKSMASDPPVTPFSKPSTPRSVRARTPREEALPGTSWYATDIQSARDSLPSTPSRPPSTPSRPRKMAPPAQKAWKKDSSPSSRGSKDARWENTWKDIFGQAEERPSTIADRPSTATSLASRGERAMSAASVLSRDVRRATDQSVENDSACSGSTVALILATIPKHAPSREVQELLAPVREGDENSEMGSTLLASLGIPPATPQTERRAYFLEGFSPRGLPPLSDEDRWRNRWRKQPPQVMVLETPPPSGGVGAVSIASESGPTRAESELGHYDPGRNRLKDHHPPSSWPITNKPSPRIDLQVRASPRPSKRSLPKQPELPKNKPAGNFYVGGKPIFAVR